MEKSDSSVLRRMKEAIMTFREPSAFIPFLKSVGRATRARAHWPALGLLVGVGIFSFWNTATLIKTNHSQMQLRMLLIELQGTLTTVADAETGQRGYLLVGEESYLEPYRTAMKVADQQIARVEKLMNAVPGQRSTFDAMKRLVAMKFADLQNTVQLRQSEGIEAAMPILRTGRGKKLMDEIRGLADEIKHEVQQRLTKYDGQTVALSRRATFWSIIGNVLAAVLFVSVLRRELRERARVEDRARELARSVETSRIQAIAQSEGEIESLGQQARVLADFVQTLQEQTLMESDKEIEALAQKARELAHSVETSRIQTLNRSDGTIEALGQQARELATSVETSRMETLMQSDGKIEALGQQARVLARSVETSRIKTRNQSTGKIEALGQQARELARSVETSRVKTRKLNEELKQRVLERTAQLEAANMELESFSYSVSHDLRAPLRAIDGFSRIVLEDYAASLAPEGKAYLQMVRDNTRQMGQLVDDLLAFSRLGRQTLAKHIVDPDKMVRRCLEEMTKEQQGRQMEIVIGDLGSCHADPILLKQVWTNLLSNALKYTRKRETARIEIGCRTEPRLVANGQPSSGDSAGPEVVYFVKDNGAGFDMKYAHKLFGVFQRLHRATEYEGTGVGLAIVQRIVQRHGGRVWAEAILDQGATFSFTLERGDRYGGP